VVGQVTALLLVRGADFLSVFDKPQRDALAMLFLRLHHGGVVANEIFWGLWLFPFGLLVYRSFTGLLFPQYEARVFNSAFPAMLGELAIMLWLLIKGVNTPCRTITAAVSRTTSTADRNGPSLCASLARSCLTQCMSAASPADCSHSVIITIRTAMPISRIKAIA
jgi:hypothetical protein